MAHEVPMEEVTESIHEHAHESRESWIGAVAMCTAFMATFAAISALLSSEAGTESLKEHGEAFDQYSYYQAKGIKSAVLQNKIDILAALDKKPSEKDAADVKRYKVEQEGIKANAEKLVEHSKAHGRCQAKLETAVTLFQVAIAMAAITVLTRRKPFWIVSLVFGAVGLYFLSTGYMSLPHHAEHEAGGAHEAVHEPAHDPVHEEAK